MKFFNQLHHFRLISQSQKTLTYSGINLKLYLYMQIDNFLKYQKFSNNKNQTEIYRKKNGINNEKNS